MSVVCYLHSTPQISSSCRPDSPSDSLERSERLNGGQAEAAKEGKEKEAKRRGSQEDSSTAGPSRGQEDKRQEGGDKSQHKVQVSLYISFHTRIYICI